MPLYIFECPHCGDSAEELLSIEERDEAILAPWCKKCQEYMVRVPTVPTLGKSAYQMKAVLDSGEHVFGHFGKDAPRLRRKS